MKIKKRSIVVYDYESLPQHWKDLNKNLFKDTVFMYLGEVSNMKGHAYLQNIKTGIPTILHIGNLRVLTEEEL